VSVSRIVSSRSLLIGIIAVAVFYGLMGVEIQCTPVGAQTRLSLTTVAAQVDALAAEVDQLQCGNVARWQLVGFTTAQLTSGAGVLAFDAACQAEFSASRFCSSVEVTESSHPTPPLTGTAWVRPIIAGGAQNTAYEAASGVGSGYASGLSCYGWSDDTSDLDGALTIDAQGRFSVQPCKGGGRSVACCALVP